MERRFVTSLTAGQISMACNQSVLKHFVLCFLQGFGGLAAMSASGQNWGNRILKKLGNRGDSSPSSIRPLFSLTLCRQINVNFGLTSRCSSRSARSMTKAIHKTHQRPLPQFQSLMEKIELIRFDQLPRNKGCSPSRT
jgi:hypothetical protein